MSNGKTLDQHNMRQSRENRAEQGYFRGHWRDEAVIFRPIDATEAI